MPLRKLGAYELIERLAVGGMAEIYLARHRGVEGFEKNYVLKLIHPKHTGDDDFIRMLIDEAKLVSHLSHHNIGQVMDLGIAEDSYYVLMEYVQGKDVHQLLDAGWEREIQVPVEVACYIAREMCAGLYYAHTKCDADGRPLNLVHRDISPQNVMVTYHGEVKILDFGVAKAALGARPETQAGIIKGKFRYMSPEQAWGEKLDGRSDLFSVGLCLWEMLTGTTAYDDGADIQRVLLDMREAKISSPREHRADIDEELERIVMRSLRKRRHERFPTAYDMQQELSAYLHRRSPGFTPARVMMLVKKLFPEDTKEAHLPEPTRETYGATNDAATEVMRTDPTDEQFSPPEQTVPETPSGHMPLAQRQAPTPPGAYDEFEDEETELFGVDHVPAISADGQRKSDTSPMENDRLLQLLEYASEMPAAADGSTNDLRSTSRRSSAGEAATRNDTIVGLVQKYLPDPAADHAIDLHRKFVEILESEQGRKFLLPAIAGVIFVLTLTLVLAIAL